jgi:hypothetical protein
MPSPPPPPPPTALPPPDCTLSMFLTLTQLVAITAAALKAVQSGSLDVKPFPHVCSFPCAF